MAEQDLRINCQRCGEPMEMKDPAPGEPWKPDQFWVCPRCGRHFWSTYPNPPGAPAAKAPAAQKPGADAPASSPPPTPPVKTE
jgi:hypothetical protein